MSRPAICMCLFLVLAGSLPARADAPRLVCLVAALTGQASLSPAEGGEKALELFTRLREGERVDLGQGAEVQLAFLQQGVSETWTGPATVVITAAGGQSTDSAGPPTIKKLPLGRQPAGGAASSILSEAGEQATAQVKTREAVPVEDKTLSDAERAELTAAEAQVAAMRQTAAPGDVSAEIVLLGTLDRLGQKRRLAEEVRRLREAYPDNAALSAWDVQ